MGYQGAKLFGLSDSDANTVRFLGSIAGGYTGSTVAGKFSLNNVEVPKTSSFIDGMSPEDARRYSKYWRKLGLGSEETWQAFKQANPTANIDDYNELLFGENPWPKGYVPRQVNLQGGYEFEIALDINQPITSPGLFATDSNSILDVNYVRNNLAVKSNWKTDPRLVVQYRVKDGVTIPALEGPVGPQIDLKRNVYLSGGGHQLNLQLPREIDKIQYLDIIGVRTIN